MSISSRIAIVVTALMLVGLGGPCLLAQLPPRTHALLAGEVKQGVVHGDGDERYWISFDIDGVVIVEVSGIPADCAIQVGSQGFQESDLSPNNWTDGQQGQTVRHSFRVQKFRPGTIWVTLRTRASAVNANGWSGVACSNNGPFYTTPARSGATGRAPGTFEGRAVLPPITFRTVALDERKLPPPSVAASLSPGTAEDQAVAEYRRLLPAVMQAERKPWHTRFEFLANAVKSGGGYHVNYRTYCLIENGPDTGKGKDYACYEFDSVLDIGTVKAAVTDFKRRLKP